MSQQEPLEETMPTAAQKRGESTQQSQPSKPPTQARPKRWRWVLSALGLFVLLAGLGALGGYSMGVSARQAQANLQSAVEANYQYELGLVDLQNGACDRAKDRFVYVIELVPDYPGVQDALIQASLCTGATPAPDALVDATSGPTPTPDLRGADSIYADAQGQLGARTWDTLLPLLDTLRKNFPDYQPIEVDRMYYVAYRNRGSDRIVAGDLERGIFDLNRAEQIGPIDADAQNYRQWATWYIVGASFWEVDWAQAVEYFQLVAPAAPNLHDLTFFTAQDRLAQALVGYAGELILEAQDLAMNKQWCSAETKIYEANGYSPLSPEVQPTATWYTEKCALNGDEQ